jgi:hypothetical protein
MRPRFDALPFAATTLFVALLILLPSSNRPFLLRAQSPIASSRGTPVTAALVEALPLRFTGYAAVVMRGRGRSGRDVVLLPRASASGALLDEATRALLHMRASTGDRPETFKGRTFSTLTIGVRAKGHPTYPTERGIARAQLVVDRLKEGTAPVQEIPGVGRVPAIEFLPPRVTTRTPASASQR